MGNYRHYADDLDRAFKAAREKYSNAVKTLTAAQDRARAARENRNEKYIGEYDDRLAVATRQLKAAQNLFPGEVAAIWDEYKATVARLTADLREEVQRDQRIKPDAVDSAALELLKSGICTVDDMRGLTERFYGNATMLKLISHYAGIEAEKHENSDADRQGYLAIHEETSDPAGKVMTNWNTLVQSAATMSGMAHDANPDIVYATRMQAAYEETIAPMIASFQ